MHQFQINVYNFYKQALRHVQVCSAYIESSKTYFDKLTLKLIS